MLSVVLDDLPDVGDWLAVVVGLLSFLMLSLFLLWLSLQRCVVREAKRLSSQVEDSICLGVSISWILIGVKCSCQ